MVVESKHYHGHGRGKSLTRREKCRKFTSLVDFDKTSAVVSSALSQGCIPLFQKLHKEQRDFYRICPHRSAMIRPYFVGIAVATVMALHAGSADAAKSRKPRQAYMHLVGSDPGRAESGQPWQGQSGWASYYGKAHHGKRTASGTRFDQNALTAAHPWLPFGTQVRVTHVASGRSVVVTITDRLPSRRRIIDLSYAAAQQLDMIRQGVAEVVLIPA